jgi:hypothetical protein
MARNDTTSFTAQATSWRALASAAVAWALAAALAVSVFALVDAVFSNPPSQLVERSASQAEPPRWRSAADQLPQFSTVLHAE